MIKPRYRAAAIPIQNGTKWWVTGGQNVTDYLNSTEILSLDPLNNKSGFVEGPILPIEQGIVAHCIARINETHIFMAGGNIPNAYIFNESSFDFVVLPDLRFPRAGAACAVVKYDNKTTLMVIGGTCLLSYTCHKQTEIYQLDDRIVGNRWRIGPMIKIGGWSHGSYITYPDERGLILIGSHPHPKAGDLSNKIIHYNEDTKLFVELQGGLKESRQEETAIYVP